MIYTHFYLTSLRFLMYAKKHTNIQPPLKLWSLINININNNPWKNKIFICHSCFYQNSQCFATSLLKITMNQLLDQK